MEDRTKQAVTLWLLLGAAFVQGCCQHSVRTVNVSRDSRFQSGYNVGTTYRLKSEAYLVQASGEPGEGWNLLLLWSPAKFDRYKATEPKSDYREVARLDPGSLFRVDRLEYSYDHYTFEMLCFAAMSHRLPEVVTFSTVTMGAATWKDVVAPVASNAKPLRVDDVFMWSPDWDLVEVVEPRGP